MHRCEKCNELVEIDDDGHYGCDHCGNFGFFIITKVLDLTPKSSCDEPLRTFWIELTPTPGQSVASFIQSCLQVSFALRERGVGGLKREWESTCRISLGPLDRGQTHDLMERAEEAGVRVISTNREPKK